MNSVSDVAPVITTANEALRRDFPLKPLAIRDALKLAFYRSATAAIKPLRASLAMRRLLRRIALGKRANYYLKRA
jgi:hypothetical protein